MLATLPNPTGQALTRGRYRPPGCLMDLALWTPPGSAPPVVKDWSGRDHPAVLHNGPATCDGGVMAFESASSHYLQGANDLAVGDAFTVVLYDFKTTVPGGSTAPNIWSLATEAPGANADGVCLFWLVANVGYYVGDETKNSAVSAAAFNAGFRSFAWTVYWAAGSILQEFADGVPQTPRGGSADHCAVTEPFRVAYPHTLFGFNEQANVWCSRVQVYNRRLTDREIWALNAQGGR